MYQNTRRQLITKASLNPFNDKFDIEQFKPLFNEYKKEELSEIISISSAFFFFNRFHREFYNLLADLIKSTDKDLGKVVDLIFAGFNRNYLVNHKMTIDETAESDEFDMRKYAARTLQSKDKGIGDVNLIAMLETEADSLNLTCNLLRHLLEDQFNDANYVDPVAPIARFMHIQYSSSLYYTLKTTYEDALWNNGDFSFREEFKAIHLNFEDQKRFFAKKAGHFRFQAISFQQLMSIKRAIELKSPAGLAFIKRLLITKNGATIKDVEIVNGRIVVNLDKSQHVDDLYSEINLLATIESFYPFIDLYKNNPTANGLSISDFVVLFSIIQQLLSNAVDKPLDTSLYSLQDLDRYPIKINAQELSRCLSLITKFSLVQIQYFLMSISSQFSERIDLWNSPLLFYNECYYFSYISIISPIATNLVDVWLDRTGYKLDARGPLFEKYIKNEIDEICRSRGFHCKIERRNKFSYNKKSEEIDAIFALKDIAFVCEVKCTKYSLTPREDHNVYSTLKGAATQANRKCQFIKDMMETDSGLKEMLDGKKIVPLIITNYPLFTGLSLEDVPVIDFFLIKSYLETGKMSSGYFNTEDGVTQKVELYSELFYSNEKEMNQNIADYLRSPPPVVNLFDKYKIVPSKITPEGLPFEVWTQYCRDIEAPSLEQQAEGRASQSR